MTNSPQVELFSEMYADRLLAHQWIFEHRHGDEMPGYQPGIIADFHDDEKHGLDLVFRGGAKSTIAEEALAIRAGFREFKFGLVLGNTAPLAAQRVDAVAHELETNPRYIAVFDRLLTGTPGSGYFQTTSGVRLMSLGRGQSMRGIKDLADRPDFLLLDDVEDWVDVRKPEQMDETWRWLTSDVLPALDPRYIARCLATPLKPNALPGRLEKDGWRTRKVPVCHPHPSIPGRRVSAWPQRFPLTDADAREVEAIQTKKYGKRVQVTSIEAREASAQRNGTMRNYNAEYMVEASHEADQAFTKKMFERIVQPRARTWQAVYAMFDPARTVNERSAMTGMAVWSWVGAELIVWESWQLPLKPDQIIDAIFEVQAKYQPTWIGVERDGLEQFLMQPLRTAQVKRGVTLPLKAIKAPAGKYDFIRTLQVWFHANEIVFAKPLPDLETAFLAFPSGKIDAPNALAYAIPMRGGAPMYGEFGGKNVGAELTPSPSERPYLALNAERTLVTGVLVQMLNGALRIFSDWVVEGEPSETLRGVVNSARLRAGGAIGLIAPPKHFDAWSNVGLRQAVSRLPGHLNQGVTPEIGRPDVRRLLTTEVRSMPGVMVSEEARWTLNGFAAGYHHEVNKQGMLSEHAEPGVYRTLMEGLESFVGAAQVSSTDETEEGTNWRTGPNGQRYETCIPEKRR